MSSSPVRLQATNFTGPVAHHAEGPVWSDAWGGLRFVDLEAGSLVTVMESGVRRLDIGDPIAAFVRPRAGGGYVVGVRQGIGLADDVDSPPNRFVQMWDDQTVRMNDGTIDPQGRLLAGGMAYDARPGAADVFRVDADLCFRPVIRHVAVSNGVAFSPGGDLCYYTDTMTGRVDIFDVVNGELEGRRPFAIIPTNDGLPDGMTTSADGSVWVALWGGSAVHGYGDDGKLHTIVDLPVSQVSACTFGGEQLSTLFITTSRQGLPESVECEAGSVFAVETGHRGMTAFAFAG